MSEIITIIRPRKGYVPIDLREIWKFRELLITLGLRDVKIRYKQTLMGGLWAIMQPFTQMIVFSFFFGKLAKIPSDGVPYPIFSYSGLILWSFFNNSLSSISNSMINNSGIIKKVYFPRLLIPISSTVVYIIDYFVAFIILLGMLLFFGFEFNISFLLIPLILLITWIFSLGIGFFLAALNIEYRDIRLALPFFIQLLLYITPVIYPSSVAGQFKWIVDLNPLSALIEAHRAIILDIQFDISKLYYSVLSALIVVILGSFYFKKVEKKFVDIV